MIFSRIDNFLKPILRLIFRVSLVTFLFLLTLEYVFPGFVTNWFNPIWILILSLFCAIIVITCYD